jgi:hypothetical protein
MPLNISIELENLLFKTSPTGQRTHTHARKRERERERERCLAASAKVSKEREFLGRRCQVFDERDRERERL